LCSDKLFTAANNFRGQRDIRFSVVRYGNVLGSRGSVVPFFLEKRKTGVLPITDERMTRFNITLEDGVKLVLFALANMQGGEIYVPKIPSYRITDLAEAIGPECQRNIVGIRPGEKLHEEMITENDAMTTLEFKEYFIMLPTTGKIRHLSANEHGGVPCRLGFRYNSGENTDWLSVEQLRTLIQKHVDPNFTVMP
ncbi:MAG: polysaccharide biosynthesis protein, partial [Desulfuromonadaceae bacterium]|nr:polysaccharide biosynthesis protein [Desulfuromonadaceae bacterium]